MSAKSSSTPSNRISKAGLYGRIFDRALVLLKCRGCKAAQVSTQTNNVALQRARARRGFRLASSVYTLHKSM